MAFLGVTVEPGFFAAAVEDDPAPEAFGSRGEGVVARLVAGDFEYDLAGPLGTAKLVERGAVACLASCFVFSGAFFTVAASLPEGPLRLAVFTFLLGAADG